MLVRISKKPSLLALRKLPSLSVSVYSTSASTFVEAFSSISVPPTTFSGASTVSSKSKYSTVTVVSASTGLSALSELITTLKVSSISSE